MISVRILASTDSIAGLTALLHRAYARLGDMGLNYTAVDQTADVTALRIAAGQCFVAEWSGDIAGTVVVSGASSQHCEYFNRPGVALMSQFAVDPPLQRRGIGKALLQAAMQWSAINGFAELAVDTAEPAVHLINFYEKFGFQRVDFVEWPGKVYRSVVLSRAISGGFGSLVPSA